MEENQVEYTKELLSYREQVNTLTKEIDELREENTTLKEQLKSKELDQDAKSTDKWKEYMSDQFKLANKGFYDD
jgi:SMC interacting uncharacterized protein involved in chromosome segregation